MSNSPALFPTAAEITDACEWLGLRPATRARLAAWFCDEMAHPAPGQSFDEIDPELLASSPEEIAESLALNAPEGSPLRTLLLSAYTTAARCGLGELLDDGRPAPGKVS